MNPPLRCLIVEDSASDAEMVVRQLRNGGYDVTSERVDTPEAMRSALGRQPWDLVIADYRMPRFSGLAALELLRSCGCDLPFIIVSGTIGEDLAVEAVKAGAHDYVMKDRLGRLVPAVKRELREAVERRERQLAEAERERLFAELQAAQARIETLSGLLPICASCKNIRDDQGSWHKIESYIQSRSKAHFSHGLCPNCVRKLYPDLDLSDSGGTTNP